jgi:hypothetical protein
MPPQLEDVIEQVRQAHRLTLPSHGYQVIREGGMPISPQYLFDIETHRRISSPYVLQELARVLELDYDTLLILAGAADTMVREYLEAHPQHTEAVIRLFRTAQEREFHD